MSTLIATVTLATTLAVANLAFAGTMDDEFKASCMVNAKLTAQECACSLAYVKTRMGTKAYTVMYALSKTEEGSEDRTSKIAALGVTQEEVQSMREKFQSFGGDLKIFADDLKTQCGANAGSGDAK
jgi:peptidyl-tRNA hydrolase